jgi:hypothetical protein
MRRLRSLAARSPAIVIATVALILSVGGGAGYAASVLNGSQIALHSIPADRIQAHGIGSAELKPAKPAKVTWHRLPLVNGWKSDAASDDTGNRPTPFGTESST